MGYFKSSIPCNQQLGLETELSRDWGDGSVSKVMLCLWMMGVQIPSAYIIARHCHMRYLPPQNRGRVEKKQTGPQSSSLASLANCSPRISEISCLKRQGGKEDTQC